MSVRKFVVSVLVAVAVGFCPAAFAQYNPYYPSDIYADVGWYGGVQYVGTNSKFESDEGFESWATPLFMRHLGFQTHPNFGVEGRYGSSAGDDTLRLPNADGSGFVDNTTEVDNFLGGFLRIGGWADKVYVYGMIGYGRITWGRSLRSSDGTADSRSLDGTDYAWGVGGEWGGGNLRGKVEWMSYYNGGNESMTECSRGNCVAMPIDDGREVNGFSFGISYRF